MNRGTVVQVTGVTGGVRPPEEDGEVPPFWRALGVLADAGVPVVVHAGHAPVGTEHTGPGPFGSVLGCAVCWNSPVALFGAPLPG
jgi:uncharacterized protein